MKKRLLPLLVLTLAVVLAAAPAAMADHCRTCRFNQCAIAASGGFPTCDDTSGTCITSGLLCKGPHPLIDEEPLAASFTVVSVERLDESKPAPSDTRVAALEAPRPVVNR